jgi:hypothetical protein
MPLKWSYFISKSNINPFKVIPVNALAQKNSLVCKLLGVVRQQYYAWLNNGNTIPYI